MDRWIATATVAAALLAAPGVAADLEAGLAAYDAGDYAAAMTEWRPLAEQGSAAAQFNVGLLYEDGLGVTADLAEAARWFLESAEGGFARAQYRIAAMYETGDGVEKDIIQAHKWFSLAATRKHEDSKNRKKRLAKQMNPSQIALSEMYARQWKAALKERKKADR